MVSLHSNRKLGHPPSLLPAFLFISPSTSQSACLPPCTTHFLSILSTTDPSIHPETPHNVFVMFTAVHCSKASQGLEGASGCVLGSSSLGHFTNIAIPHPACGSACEGQRDLFPDLIWLLGYGPGGPQIDSVLPTAPCACSV